MTRGWHYLVGDDGAVIGLDFTVDHVVDAATAVLEGTAHPAVSTP
jgi:transketolase